VQWLTQFQASRSCGDIDHGIQCCGYRYDRRPLNLHKGVEARTDRRLRITRPSSAGRLWAQGAQPTGFVMQLSKRHRYETALTEFTFNGAHFTKPDGIDRQSPGLGRQVGLQ